MLGCSPPSGFGVASRVEGERLELAGRHRFSRYRLVFALAADASGGTRLSATTYAAFPGPHGAAYRFVVIGLGPHVLATRRMLAAVDAPRDPSPLISIGSERSGSLPGGGVSERPKEHASKACVGASPPWVQIPPPPHI